MSFIFITLIFLISAIIVRILIPRALLISLRKKFPDIPDDRKTHERVILCSSGVSFFPTTLFTFCLVYTPRLLGGDSVPTLYASYLLSELLLFACGMTLFYLAGIADDLAGVCYRQKFVIQIFRACPFLLSGLWINDSCGLFGIHKLSVCVGIPFTILTVVFITSVINLIDGIDGLASGLSDVALLTFTFLLIEKGLWSYAMLAIGTLGVLAPFFYYNVFGSMERARKIFMGDMGSPTLGYTPSFLATKYSQHSVDITPYTEGAFIIVFGTMIILAFDVVHIASVCIREGHSPFGPDKNHIHHKLLTIGLSPRKAMLSLFFMFCSFSTINILLVPYVNNTVSLVVDIVTWVGPNPRWDYLRDKK